MKNLIVCCDGTWNTPDDEHDGVPTPTNVFRLFNVAEEGPTQRKYYHPGVGTEGAWWMKVAGGAVGVGLSANIKSAYKWLAEHYAPDDRVFLFGFSRGAYTARSLGGMIGRCGLLNLAGLDDETVWQRVDAAYDAYRGRKAPADWATGFAFSQPTAAAEVGVHFVGVWDTVGALGVPNDLAILNLLDDTKKYAFHDTELSPKVAFARHAVALDELRASFAPTLWQKVAAADLVAVNGDPPRVKQVWFPGVHSDVGGGYPETGLSDGALEWMLTEAAACGLLVDSRIIQGQVNPSPRDVLHNSCGGPWKLLRTQPRSVPLMEAGPLLHPSALARQAAPPITQAPYRKSTRLAAGQTAQRQIFANQPWNYTGIYLEQGATYRFKASGQWLDSSIKSGPQGENDGKFQSGELIHIGLSLWGQVEKLFRKATNNDLADFKGTKREENHPWFSLLGAVANGGNPQPDGSAASCEIIAIGEEYRDKQGSTSFTCQQPGYLYCFANDAWHYYDNNRGSVLLTVERVN